MKLPHRGGEAPVASPCTNVCRIDADTGWCAGCLRNLDEIAAWSGLDNAERRAVLAVLPARRRHVARVAAQGTSAPSDAQDTAPPGGSVR